ncbi:MAG: amidohydrolase family protein [Clostridia bacterium]|nr:amidohydrolase family protein [Clostridia bacterium]
MLIDSHIHLGNKKECEEIINNSRYKNKYKIYSCINPKTIDGTDIFLRDVDGFFAIPLFFCETDIEKANTELINRVENDSRAIPILLMCKNENLNNLIFLLNYNILKEHFTLHNPHDISDRNETYDYLNSKGGFLLLHTLSSSTYQHVITLRKQYPKMKIIVAHLGRDGKCDYDFTTDMIDKLHSDENIYTDISTIQNPKLIRYAFKRFGSSRILYGSDFPFERTPGIKEEDYIQPAIKANLKGYEYDDLFYRNAEEIIRTAYIEKGRDKDGMEH